MSEKGIHERLMALLSPLPYPCRLQVSGGTEPIYITWYEMEMRPVLHAGNRVKRYEQVAQVSIYGLEPIDEAVREVLDALTGGGFHVSSCGPQGYLPSSSRYHYPIICRVGVKHMDKP